MKALKLALGGALLGGCALATPAPPTVVYVMVTPTPAVDSPAPTAAVTEMPTPAPMPESAVTPMAIPTPSPTPPLTMTIGGAGFTTPYSAAFWREHEPTAFGAQQGVITLLAHHEGSLAIVIGFTEAPTDSTLEEWVSSETAAVATLARFSEGEVDGERYVFHTVGSAQDRFYVYQMVRRGVYFKVGMHMPLSVSASVAKQAERELDSIISAWRWK